MSSLELLKIIATSPRVWRDVLKILSLDPTVANEKPAEAFLATPEEKQIVVETLTADTLDKVAEVFHFSSGIDSPDTMPPDTTVGQMLEYYKTVVLKKYKNNKEVQDSLAQWEKLKDEVVYWTDNEKEVLKETIKNTIKWYRGDELRALQSILRACGHKIRKEIREKDQIRLSFEEVGEKLKKAGIKIREQHKGDPDKPTFIFRGQTHGNVSFPGVKASQDSIYVDQIKLIMDSICLNFGFEGLPFMEIHPDLTPGKMEEAVSYGYGSKKEKKLMNKYPNTFYYGLEDPETTAKAHIANDNYLLMLKIARHQNFKKVNFGKGMGSEMYLTQLKLHFSRFAGYKNIEKVANDLFQKKSIVTYQDHSEFFTYFLLEWQKWVINERNKKIIEIGLQMANNTKYQGREYVSSEKIGEIHMEEYIIDMTWIYSVGEAKEKMLTLQEVAEEAGCGYYRTD